MSHNTQNMDFAGGEEKQVWNVYSQKQSQLNSLLITRCIEIYTQKMFSLSRNMLNYVLEAIKNAPLTWFSLFKYFLLFVVYYIFNIL